MESAATRPSSSISSSTTAPLTPAEIHGQLARILASNVFRGSPRLQRFLTLAVERTLAGETDQLKEYAVGRDVFDRGADYDPRMDSIVRVEARRLRRKLREFYRTALNEPVVIGFPRGSYVAEFTRPAPETRGASLESEPGTRLRPIRAPSPSFPSTISATIPSSNISATASLKTSLTHSRRFPNCK